MRHEHDYILKRLDPSSAQCSSCIAYLHLFPARPRPFRDLPLHPAVPSEPTNMSVRDSSLSSITQGTIHQRFGDQCAQTCRLTERSRTAVSIGKFHLALSIPQCNLVLSFPHCDLVDDCSIAPLRGPEYLGSRDKLRDYDCISCRTLYKVCRPTWPLFGRCRPEGGIIGWTLPRLTGQGTL